MDFRLAGIGLAAVLVAGTAQAQQTLVGQYGAWRAFKDRADGTTICFVISEPVRRLPSGLRRGPAFLFMTHRPSQNVWNQLTVDFGFPVDSAADTALSVGSDSYELMESGEDAWLDDLTDTDRLVASLRQGSTASIAARSARGNETTDMYSLSGFTRALEAATSACRSGG